MTIKTPQTLTNKAHQEFSTLREKILEHMFIGDALQLLWRYGVFDVEILRSEFDAHGYDLVVGRGKIVRHIQFKAGVQKKPRYVSVPLALADKPSGCVIWTQVDNDLNVIKYWWFGAENPNEPIPHLGDHIPNRIGRTKEGFKPPRKKHRKINGSKFRPIDTLEKVLETLLGTLPKGNTPILADEN